ncbi:hypothetical protein P5673_025993 [Acropora cervicornis]|uniref:Uncharacterized protein n=1 Tax=Acropora cervicornis TaxID=6130 RepID=A0AAD9Q124_ACRCE|nr:hypothetical protein P5673_025993 [Acropora cervicornis]
MVLPFERQPLLHKRYAALSSPDLTRSYLDENGDSIEGEEYANFLKALASGERQDPGVSKPKPSAKGQTGHPTQGNKDSKPGKKSSGTTVSPQRTSGLLQDHMLQHKQEERALKRYEGDIIKKQHHLRRTMEDVNNSVYKKMRAEEARLSENNHEMEKVKQHHFIQEDKINKARIEKNLSSQMKIKDKGRKVALEMTQAEFQYCKAAKKLELTRTEVFALTQQFEASLKRIEEKGDALKKSLAELAIAANQLALKKRTQEVEDERYNKDKTIKDIQDDRRRQQSLSEKLKSISGQGVKVEYNKRRMSRDLLVSKDMLSLKSREEGRKMTDINRRLQHNSTHQKQAKQAAEYLELDRQGKEIEEKGQEMQEQYDRKKVELEQKLLREKAELAKVDDYSCF